MFALFLPKRAEFCNKPVLFLHRNRIISANMKRGQDNFYINKNIANSFTEDDCRRAEYITDVAENLCQMMVRPCYILDFHKNGVTYASESMGLIVGLKPAEIVGMEHKFYRDYIHNDDLLMIDELWEKTCKFFASDDNLLGCQYHLRFHLKLRTESGYRLFNHTSFPLLWSKGGHVMVVVCTLSPSSRKESGNASLFLPNVRRLFRYDFHIHKWKERDIPSLSERERDVVRLSAQGLSVAEIATTMCKSVESVKLYRQQLFRKLGVNNMSAAMTFILNHGLP